MIIFSLFVYVRENNDAKIRIYPQLFMLPLRLIKNIIIEINSIFFIFLFVAQSSNKNNTFTNISNKSSVMAMTSTKKKTNEKNVTNDIHIGSTPLDNIVFMIFDFLLGSAKITEKSLRKNEQNEKLVEKLSFRILLFQVCSFLRSCPCLCFFFILVESISFVFVLCFCMRLAVFLCTPLSQILWFVTVPDYSL